MSREEAVSIVLLKEIHEEVRHVRTDISDFRKEVGRVYVTKTEFVPVKTVVYGMIGLILVSVATAMLASVVKAAL